MFSITVFHGPAQPLIFLFRNKETFEAAHFNPRFKWWSVIDDFGQRGDFQTAMVSVFSEDMEQSKLATIERSLHVARIQASVNSRAMADPVLKTMMGGGGPAMISPAGLNGRLMGPA